MTFMKEMHGKKTITSMKRHQCQPGVRCISRSLWMMLMPSMQSRSSAVPLQSSNREMYQGSNRVWLISAALMGILSKSSPRCVKPQSKIVELSDGFVI